MLSKTIKSRFRQFFANRSPRIDSIELNIRNVYIFFSRGGLLFAMLLLCTFIAGINYGNNLVLGLCFYLASIWVISLHITFAHISGLKVSLSQTSLTQQGDNGWATIVLENDKSKPSRQLLLMFDSDQDEIEETKADFQENKKNSDIILRHYVASLLGKQRLQLPIKAGKRGKMILPRLIISTVYPLGIMRAWSYVYFAKPLWVYPKPLPFEMQIKQVTASDDSEAVSLHSTAGQNDFEMLDQYVEGESLARVSWTHFARGQGMLSKHFADPLGQEQLIDYADMPASHHEDKLSQLTFAVLQLANSPYPFQLNLPNDIGEIGQGDAFVQACLLRLAQCP